MAVFDRETFERLLPLAYEWAKQLEEFVIAHGHPLGTTHLWDAHLAGVQDSAKIRVLVVDRIPLPENPKIGRGLATSPDHHRGHALHGLWVTRCLFVATPGSIGS